MDTSCSTTRVRASGRPPGPYSTRPETTIPCAPRPAAPAPLSSASSARLRSELPDLQRHRDGARLGGPDPNGKDPFPLLLLENDDGRVGRAIEPQVGDPNLDDVRAQVPISHDARYFCCSGVSVSMATPIAASFNRAISASRSRGMRCTSLPRLRGCSTPCSP